MGYRSPPEKITQMIGQELGKKIKQHHRKKRNRISLWFLVVFAILILVLLIYINKEFLLNYLNN